MENYPQLGALYPPVLTLHGEQFRYGSLRCYNSVWPSGGAWTDTTGSKLQNSLAVKIVLQHL